MKYREEDTVRLDLDMLKYAYKKHIDIEGLSIIKEMVDFAEKNCIQIITEVVEGNEYEQLYYMFKNSNCGWPESCMSLVSKGESIKLRLKKLVI